MRGQGWQIEEMLKVFLVIVIFGISLLILINVASWLAWFDCENPEFARGAGEVFCPEYVLDPDYLIAKESTEQLICAIDSTISGADQNCFKAGDAEFGDVYVECKFAGAPQLVAEPSTWQKIKNWFADFFDDEEDVPYGCQVKNFKLPQQVNNAEEWISGYGDPKFLTYYESFPVGEEEAWTGYATWMENVGTVVLFSMPVGSLVSGGKKWVSGTVATVKDSVKTKTWLSIDSLFTRMGWNKDKITILMFEEGVSQVAKQQAYQSVGKKLLNTLSSDQVRYGMKAAKKTTPLAFISAWLDTTNDKFERYPNQVVLKQPYYKIKSWGLKGRWAPIGLEYAKPADVPVVLDKQGVINDYIDKDLVNFYMASPCDANLLVERSTVYCSSYEFDPDGGGVVCGYEDLSDACVGSINILEREGRMPYIDIPMKQCADAGRALDYIPVCANEKTANFDVIVGAVVGTSNTHCLKTGIKVKATDKNGFCYSEPSKYTTPVFVGALLADGILTYFSAGTLTQVAVGVTGGIVYTVASQYENWP